MIVANIITSLSSLYITHNSILKALTAYKLIRLDKFAKTFVNVSPNQYLKLTQVIRSEEPGVIRDITSRRELQLTQVRVEEHAPSSGLHGRGVFSVENARHKGDFTCYVQQDNALLRDNV